MRVSFDLTAIFRYNATNEGGLTARQRTKCFCPKLIFSLANLSLLFYVFLLIVLHVLSPDPLNGQLFPQGCDSTNACVRITSDNTSVNPIYYPVPVLSNVSNVAIVSYVEMWVGEMASTAILSSANGVVHARFVSIALGLADDFWMQLRPNGTETELWLQSQARLRTDFGSNSQRMASFINDLQQHFYT
jgi:uncharacterized protein (DUF1499 family)